MAKLLFPWKCESVASCPHGNQSLGSRRLQAVGRAWEQQCGKGSQEQVIPKTNSWWQHTEEQRGKLLRGLAVPVRAVGHHMETWDSCWVTPRCLKGLNGVVFTSQWGHFSTWTSNYYESSNKKVVFFWPLYAIIIIKTHANANRYASKHRILHVWVPFSRQWLRLWTDGCHRKRRLPYGRRDRKIQIQGACFSVQWFHLHCSLHFTFNGAGACSSMARERRQFRSYCTLQHPLHHWQGVMCWGHWRRRTGFLFCWSSCQKFQESTFLFFLHINEREIKSRMKSKYRFLKEYHLICMPNFKGRFLDLEQHQAQVKRYVYVNVYFVTTTQESF